MTKKSRQKLKYLENEKSFWDFSSFIKGFQLPLKLPQTWECAFKGTAKWQTKWRWSNFSSLTIFEFTNQDKKLTFSQQEHLQIFSTLLAKWNMCQKIFSISATKRIIRTRSSIFDYLTNMNINIESFGL